MTAEVFTLFAYDLNTNTKLTELPANGLSYSRRLNDFGSLSGTLQIQSKQIQPLVAPILAYNGVPFKAYVDRNGVIVGAFIVWTGNYARSTGQLDIGGKELGSYFSQRVAAADYSNVTYTTIDPDVLVWQAFVDAQNATLSGAGSSIGLNVINAGSGLTAIVPGYPIGQHTKVAQIAEDMADIVQPGAGTVDCLFTSAWDPVSGNPVDTLTILTPRAGRIAGQSGVIFDLQSCVDYTWPTDATASGTTIIVTGAGNGNATPTAVVTAPGVPVGGLGQSPRLDLVESVTSQSQAQVSAMALGLANQFGAPVATPTVTVPTGGVQPIGSWIMGDDARLYTAGDERFPSGLDQYWRIVQEEVTIPDAGVATVELTFNLPVSY